MKIPVPVEFIMPEGDESEWPRGIMCTILPGAISQGDNEAHALEMIQEAIQGCIDSYKDDNEVIPWDYSIKSIADCYLVTVEV